MNNMIPKEKLSAYQRWEMASLGDTPKTASQAQADAQRAEAERQQMVEQLARLREQALQEGYAAGLEQGREEGLRQGYADGMAQSADASQRLQQLTGQLAAEIGRADEAIAADLLQLALDLSKAMLKDALAARPEMVLPVVGEAIRYLPALHQPALLYLHPDDMPLVQEHMHDELTKGGWRLVEDHHMERGGCRVETATNQVDASLQTRWQRISAALGKPDDWLA
ncbi:flagellar assembly protein FliH [Noviherbaspirillum humi]|uniref:Flagellar assembly protein FliH n=1 Tax=Noviherbaspirillum humi TaxID=1688639 RepID=A0A239FXL8_9BURK|nr:flagellar assembly protein FliH [Noviherbaspirillum humi]SNS61495.1 flagellar assembly protein FliH [Noviherbaspirillum humi]